MLLMVMFIDAEQLTESLEVLCTCSSEVGLAVGILILIEGVVAIVTAIIVVLSWKIMRYIITTFV